MRKRVMVAWMAVASALAFAQTPPVQKPAPAATPAAPVTPADVVLETAQGEIVIRLLPDLAPAHVRLFKNTVKLGKLDGTIFHRVIAGGIIQGGDPNTKDPAKAALYGQGGLGILKAEFSDRPFVRGTVAAARQPSSKDSGGTQFFICLRDQPGLKGQYTIFGEVTAGIEVADKISATPVDGDKPKTRVEIRKATLRDVPPS
jgi:peptidyl-prolyl cis-trans isomerase B (cyclophilin B)